MLAYEFSIQFFTWNHQTKNSVVRNDIPFHSANRRQESVTFSLLFLKCG